MPISPTPVLLPGKSHGQRSLVGCSPWGRQESDTTKRLHLPFSLSCTGEGNGSPLQCSCLENPRGRGVWWAAICEVTQSRTRLKWLSSTYTNSSRSQKGSFKYLLNFYLQLCFDLHLWLLYVHRYPFIYLNSICVYFGLTVWKIWLWKLIFL